MLYTGVQERLRGQEEVGASQGAGLQEAQLQLGDTQRKLQAADERCSQITQQKQKLVGYLQ